MADHTRDPYLRLQSTPTQFHMEIPPHAHPYPNPNPAFNSMQQPHHNPAPQLNAQMTATGRTYHYPQTPIPGYLPPQARPIPPFSSPPPMPMYPLVHLDQLTKIDQRRPPQRRNRRSKSPTRRSSAEKEKAVKAKPVLPKPFLRSGHSECLLVPPLAAQQEGNYQRRNAWNSTPCQPAVMAGNANAPDFSVLVQQQLLAAVEVDLLQQGMTMRLLPPSLPTPHPAATSISAPLSALTTAYPPRYPSTADTDLLDAGGGCMSGQDNPFTAVDSSCTAAEETNDWLLMPTEGGDGPGDMPADISIPGVGMGGSGGLDPEWLAANVSDFSDLEAALETPLDAAARVLQQEVVGDVGCSEDEVKKWLEGFNKSGGEEVDVPLPPSDFMAIAAAIEGWEGGGREEVGTAGGNGGPTIEEKAEEEWGGACAVNRLQLPPVPQNYAELPAVKPVAKMGGEVAVQESRGTRKRGAAQSGEEQPQKKKPKDRALTQDRTNELRSMIPNAKKNIDQLYHCAANRLEHLQLAVSTLTQRKQEQQHYEGDTRNSVADAIGYGMKQGLPVEMLRIIPREGNRFVIEVFLGNNEDVSVQNVLLALDDLTTVVSGGCEEQEGFFWGRYIVKARGQATWSSIHENLEEKLNGALNFHGNYHVAPTHAFEKGSDWLVGKGSWN